MLILFIIIVIILLVLLESYRETHTFRTTHYQVTTDKLSLPESGKSILVLSDLHNCTYGEKNENLIKEIKKQNPDIILLAGDILTAKPGESIRQTEEFVEAIASVAPIYYGLGNHEQRIKEQTKKYGNQYSQYKRKLIKAGVTFLENASKTVYLGQHAVEITGLMLPTEYYQRLKKNEFSKVKMKRCVENVKEDSFQILIAHHPGYFETYKEWGADLVVSGHLHGGIIRIPGFRGLITPQAFLFPKYSGEMTKEGSSTIIVSKGIGIHTVKFRFLNPSELVMIHLNNEKEIETR